MTKLKAAAEPLISRGRSEVVTRYGQLMEANKQVGVVGSSAERRGVQNNMRKE